MSGTAPPSTNGWHPNRVDSTTSGQATGKHSRIPLHCTRQVPDGLSMAGLRPRHAALWRSKAMGAAAAVVALVLFIPVALVLRAPATAGGRVPTVRITPTAT